MTRKEENDQSIKPIVTAGWFSILIVYLLLFLGTGYIAFFPKDFSPARVDPDTINKFNSEEIRTYVIETLKQETGIFAKKRELASQSFNVVLGAILGFLSASATSYFGVRKKRPNGSSSGSSGG
jgi:hypothetical protein